MITYRLDKMDDIQITEKDRTPHAEYELFNTEEYRRIPQASVFNVWRRVKKRNYFV